MTDPRDGQPRDDFGSGDPFGPGEPSVGPGESSAPTTPPAPTHPGGFPAAPNPPSSAPNWNPPTSNGPTSQPLRAHPDETEYVVHSGPHPVPPTAFQDAPDPFGGAADGGAVPPEGEKKSGKKWIIPVAAVVVLAVVAAAVYFLFFQSDTSDRKADPSPNSKQSEPQRGEESGSAESEAPPSEESEGSDSSGSATAAAIAGTFSVNGTIESYSGPVTGQLGGTPKTAGSPAFTSPQTWAIDDCTDSTCALTVQESEMTLTLELADGTWTGEATQQIACSLSASSMTDATIKIEIPEAGGTAKRTMSAQCDEPLQEVDALTLTPQ